MTNKLFDSFVSDKLSNYESPVPDGLWEKIIAQEDEKPKIIFWWNNKILLLVFALLLSASTIGYFSIKNASKKSNSTKVLPFEYSSNTTVKNDVNTTKAVNSELNINSTKSITKNSSTKSIEYDNTIIKNEADKNAVLKYSNAAIERKFTNDNKRKSITNFYLPPNKIKSIIDKKEIVATNFLKLGKHKIIEKDLMANDVDYTDTKKINEKSLNTLALSGLRGKLMFADAKNLALKYQFKEHKSLDLRSLFSGTDDCPTTRGKIRNDIYFEGYISPDIAYKTVASTMNGNADYLQKKDSSESMQLGYTIGARFSKSITNNLLIKAGLQYSQMNEKFTLRTENDRRQTIVINTHTIVRAGLPDTTISDTSVFVQIGYRVRSNMNYYRNLEIPILLSYELGQPEDKWRIAINGGAILNVTSWYDGKTIDAGYNVINIGSKSNNGFYKHQFGVSLYGGVSIIRNINPTLDVFAEPYFRFGLNNVQSAGGFTQKFNVIGLQLGARLKINSNKHL